MIYSFFFDLLVGFPLSVITVKSVYSYMLPEENANPVVFFTLFTVIFALFIRHSMPKQKTVSFSALSLWLVITVLFSVTRGNKMFSEANFWILNSVVAGLLIVLVTRIVSFSRWTRAGLSVILVAALVLEMVYHRNPPESVVAWTFFLCLVSIGDIIQQSGRKSGDDNPVKHIVLVSPFILILAIVTIISPAPEDPYEWPVTKRLYEKTRDDLMGLADRFHIRGAGGDSAESFIGFSEKGILGTLVNGKEKPVMKITTGADTSPYLYIVGKNFDTFTGREWEATNTSLLDDVMFNNASIVASVAMTGTENPGDYYKNQGVRIKYERLYSDRFLAPPRTNIYSIMLKDYKIRSEGYDTYFSKKHGLNTEYDTSYMILNRNKDYFADYINGASTITPKQWERVCNVLQMWDTGNYSYDKYEEWNREVHDIYSENVEISPELEARLNALFEGADSNYERLLLLEKELNTYNYDTAPGKLPESVDSSSAFLDYFMLETKNGYCSYYATAFTLVARYLGLPARYVQGYNIQTPARSIITVTSNQAHAWPEVYFDNVGWIPFEPTPGYNDLKVWMSHEETMALYAGNKEKTAEEWEAYYASHPYEPEYDFEDTEADGDAGKESFFKWYYPLVVLGAALIITIIAISADWAVVRRRVAGYDAPRLAAYLCRQNFRMLGFLGFPMNEGETLEEYKKRITGEYSDTVTAFIESNERILYSGSVDYDSELKVIRKSGDRLDGILKDEKKLMYYYYRIRLIR